MRGRVLPAVLMAILLGGSPLPAWEWASITLERDSLTLGDPLTLTIRVAAAPGELVDWPLPGRELLGGWRLLGADSLRTEEGAEGRLLMRTLRLARFQLGPAPLPVPGPWREGRPALGDTLRLEILGTLPDDAQAADILEPGRLAHGMGWWLARLGLVLLAALAAGLGWRWWRRAGQAPAEPPLPPDPWQDFLDCLGAIQERGLWRRGEVETHYGDLSLALRGLLEDCLDLPCRERSTEELRELLRGSALDGGDLEALFLLLEENDWVKYARRWPAAETCARQVERYQQWAVPRKEKLLARHRALLAAHQAVEARGEEQ
ncbi:MAG: hypothetical protein Q8O14_03730 [bacterium]|nr:hypothetical protein [bacterium]